MVSRRNFVCPGFLLRGSGIGLRGFLLQKVYSLGKGQARGYRAKIREDVAGLDVELLHEKNLARECEFHVGNLPLMSANIGLLHQKTAPAIEMAQNSPAKPDILLQRGVDLRKQLVGRVDEQMAFHASKDLLHA